MGHNSPHNTLKTLAHISSWLGGWIDTRMRSEIDYVNNPCRNACHYCTLCGHTTVKLNCSFFIFPVTVIHSWFTKYLVHAWYHTTNTQAESIVSWFLWCTRFKTTYLEGPHQYSQCRPQAEAPDRADWAVCSPTSPLCSHGYFTHFWWPMTQSLAASPTHANTIQALLREPREKRENKGRWK